MARFASSGSQWRRLGPLALIGATCLTLAGVTVTALDRQRATPDLTRITAERARLERSRQQLEALPPVRSIHWQMRQLRQIARALPDISEMEAIEADPDLYPEAVRQRIGSFGGTVWKVALRGSLSSVIQLCRIAQPLMPLIVDEVQGSEGIARAALFVLGANPSYGEDA